MSDNEGSLWTATGIIGLIASWLITNLVLQPMGFAIAYTEWAYEAALNGIQTAVTTALGGAGSAVFEGIDGAQDSAFDALEVIAESGGIASPIPAILAVVIVGTVVGIVIVVAVRYTAGYIPGGSYIQ